MHILKINIDETYIRCYIYSKFKILISLQSTRNRITISNQDNMYVCAASVTFTIRLVIFMASLSKFHANIYCFDALRSHIYVCIATEPFMVDCFARVYYNGSRGWEAFPGWNVNRHCNKVSTFNRRGERLLRLKEFLTIIKCDCHLITWLLFERMYTWKRCPRKLTSRASRLLRNRVMHIKMRDAQV